MFRYKDFLIFTLQFSEDKYKDNLRKERISYWMFFLDRTYFIGVIRRRMSLGFLFRDPLTTVRLYMEFMGEYAVRMLEERIVSGREISVKVTVPTKLYVRDRVSRMSELPAGSSLQPDDSFKS